MPATSIMAQRTTAFLMNEAAPFVVGSVLDVGCGNKPYRRLFPDSEWTGLDARPVGEIEADMDTLPAEPQYDTVLCTDALQFSRTPRRAVASMAAAVKSGGHLIITVPNCWHEDAISRWRVTVGGLGELVGFTGMEIVYLDGLTGLFEELANDYRNTFGMSASLPANFNGWIGHLDSTYPMLSAVIARKP